MLLGIQKIYFEWDEELIHQWPRESARVCGKINNRLQVLTQKSTNDELYILVVMFGKREDTLSQRMDEVVDLCVQFDLGRIESERRSFKDANAMLGDEEEEDSY